MKRIAFLSGLISGFLTSSMVLPVMAQVNSDGTTNTTININGNNFTILNGIQKGSNLFHSFKEFSIPTGGSATFDNSGAIENIINRVTGGNISNIDGLIKSQGSANLFLINPAGIVFGENARLDIGGSFLGTTAESILFEDGFEFSAMNTQGEPLLTVSVPLGLQMGQNPGDITIRGNGHNQTYPQTTGTPFIRSNSSRGLEVSEGQTIGLVAGNIFFDSGVLTAEGGTIELGAVGKNNSVNLNPSATVWQFDYEGVSNFGNIELNERSLVDASGNGTGSIQLQGKQIELKDASTLLIQNNGTQDAGTIQVNATDALVMQGNSLGGLGISELRSETLSNGESAEIVIDTQQLTIKDGAQIASRTFVSGSGGDINIRATDRIDIHGFNTNNPAVPSSIATVNYVIADNSGDILISTGQLNILSAVITSASLGSSKGGDVTINATESVELSEVNPFILAPSNISVVAFSSGDAGILTINTEQVTLKNGGQITSTTLASGSAGNLTINASKFVEVEGQFVKDASTVTSQISAASDLSTPILRQTLGLPALPTGRSGDVSINTPALRVRNGASVSVRNDGLSGNAGSLKVNSDYVFLDNKASLSAIARDGRGGDIILDAKTLDMRNEGSVLTSTESGTGGNIELNLQELLLMRKQSLIDTESLGIGNGGNITINSPVIAGFENSDIIANAVEGNGGNINITTSGIFGLEFREELTPESDITASSQFGVNGTVEINNISIDPNSGLVELPTELTDPSKQIASGCSSNNESSFVATGRGGIPHNPNQYLNFNRTWSDLRDFSASGNQRNSTEEITQIRNKPAIVEATGLIRNENGVIEFVVLENTPLRNKQVGECSGTHM